MQDEHRWVCCKKIIIMIIMLVIIIMMMMMMTTLHHALHPQADFDKIYFKRSEGSRGLMSVDHSANSEMNRLSRYVESCNGSLFEAVYNEGVLRYYAKVVKTHHYSKKEKSPFSRNNFKGSFGGTH